MIGPTDLGCSQANNMGRAHPTMRWLDRLTLGFHETKLRIAERIHQQKEIPLRLRTSC